MKRQVVTITVTLAALAAAPVASGTFKPLSTGQVQAHTDKVRAQEKKNKFHIRDLIGGPFRVRAAHCSGGSLRVQCGYDVEGTEPTEPDGAFRRVCRVKVRVTKSPRTNRIAHQRLEPECKNVGIPGSAG